MDSSALSHIPSTRLTFHAVDASYDATLFIDGKDRSRLRAIFRHARADSGLVVVRATLEFGRSALVTYARLSGLLKHVVIALAAVRAAIPPGNPLNQSVHIHVKFDHVIEGAAMLVQNGVERMRLLGSTGVAVKNGPHLIAHALKLGGDQCGDYFIRDELTRVHNRLGLQANRSLRLYSSPQHIAGRKLAHAVARHQPLRLCAFTGPRRPEKYDIQLHVLPVIELTP